MLTLDGALLNACYLNLLCRHSNIVDIACRSNMTNSFCSGIIGTNGSGVLRRPSYYVMQLYAEHVLPIPLTVGKAPRGVDVIACADESRARLCIFAVNSSREPVSLMFELTDFSDRGALLSVETVGDSLDMRQPDVMNHWHAPHRVRNLSRNLTGREVALPALSVSAIRCGTR
jgi:alpha-L-arabinofuranosidase